MKWLGLIAIFVMYGVSMSQNNMEMMSACIVCIVIMAVGQDICEAINKQNGDRERTIDVRNDR
jgi:hypothetical protein